MRLVGQFAAAGNSRCIQKLLIRFSAVVAVAVSATAVCWYFAAPSWADTPSVTVQLSPSVVPADGNASSTATATVHDAGGNALSGETVTFTSSDAGDTIGSVTDNGNGTYSATITSSTTPGQATITATDAALSASGQATLTQTPGPAAHVGVSLQPSSIVANGISDSTATMTVTDAHGNAVPGDNVHFSSTDPGELVGQVTDNGDGTYTARIRSSATVGHATITGTDDRTHVSGHVTLTQTNSPSTTALAVSPSPAVSNQPVTLLAAVSGGPHGTVTFANSGTPIAGCANQPVAPSSATAACTTSFGAASGLVHVTATFSPDADSTVDGSSGTATLPVGQDSTTVSLGLSSPAVKIGGTENLVAFVTPAHMGSLSPSGTVSFSDSGRPIAGCTSRSLLAAGGGGTATCAVRYTGSGTHKISAIYTGDANFAGSQASPANLPVQFLGTLKASMRWSFVSGPGYTSVLALMVNGAPIGSTVLVNCHGKGCPFSNRAFAVNKTKRCGPKGNRLCLTHGNVDLSAHFARRHLRPRTTITVDVVRPGWIGRAYTFVVRARQAPNTKAVCVAPGVAASSTC